MSASDGSRPGGRPGAVHREWPADPRVLADVRRTVGAWLGGIDVSADVRDDLVYAISEAASNAVEHAYSSSDPSVSDRLVTITMWSEPGMVFVDIADRGSWLPATTGPTTRGHGLQLIRGLVDSVSIDSRSGGTTVSLRHPVPNVTARSVQPACGA